MVTTSSTQLEGVIHDMNFKGYSASLGGVYKLHNGEKVYQLAIKNTAFEEVFESNYIFLRSVSTMVYIKNGYAGRKEKVIDLFHWLHLSYILH